MGFVRIADEDGIFPLHLAGGEELLGLLDGTTEVLFGMDDEDGRVDLGRAGERRMVDILLGLSQGLNPLYVGAKRAPMSLVPVNEVKVFRARSEHAALNPSVWPTVQLVR